MKALRGSVFFVKSYFAYTMLAKGRCCSSDLTMMDESEKVIDEKGNCGGLQVAESAIKIQNIESLLRLVLVV